MTFENIQNFRGEAWEQLIFDPKYNIVEDEMIYISNYGRLVKLRDYIPKIIKPYVLNGYPQVKIKTTVKIDYRNSKIYKYKGFYVHKLVGEYFLEKGGKTFVLHLDYNKINNKVDNLKWADKREKELHQWKNPVFIESRKKNRRPTAKLTENNVRLIKKMLNDPNRRTRLKIIAKRFGVTTMQLQRIKTGENWSDIPSL